MLYEFCRLHSPGLKGVFKKNPLTILPVGQMEEHGAHLPVDTDCVIASETARAISERSARGIPILLMNPIFYGYSGKIMAHWPGTIQIRMDTVRDYVYDVCASIIDMGVEKIAIINGHGHHRAILEIVARKLADEKDVGPVVLEPGVLARDALKKLARGGTGGSCHAGELETSLMLYLRPDSVDMSAAVDENPVFQKLAPPPGVFWSTWQRQKTKSGIYGKPSAALAQSGKVLFKTIVAKAADFLQKYYRHKGKAKGKGKR